MVNQTEEPTPEGGAEPVPVQPMQTYHEPRPAGTGDVTSEEAVEPSSYHPWPVGLPKGELTVR